jgi:hypothetical protein
MDHVVFWKKLIGAATLAAALIAPNASAESVTLDAGETAVFNYDASALIPYFGAFMEIHGPAMNGFQAEMWSDFGGAGTLVEDCLAEVICIELVFDALVADGDFSIVLTNLGALTQQGPSTATYTFDAGGLGQFASRLSLDPVSQVPLPSTLALLGAALMAAGILRMQSGCKRTISA